MNDIISKRHGQVIEIGNSIGLTIREELLDLGIEPKDTVSISVVQDDDRKKIVIEKTRKKT